MSTGCARERGEWEGDIGEWGVCSWEGKWEGDKGGLGVGKGG